MKQQCDETTRRTDRTGVFRSLVFVFTSVFVTGVDATVRRYLCKKCSPVSPEII